MLVTERHSAWDSTSECTPQCLGNGLETKDNSGVGGVDCNRREERADFEALEKMLAGRIDFSIIDDGMGREIRKTVVWVMFMVKQNSSPSSLTTVINFWFSFLKICCSRPEGKAP